MFAVINSVGLLGLNAFAVKVEIEASKGLPSFDIVGLADASVKESRERVRSALRSSEITLPLRKIIINLAPADVRKTGSVYDLAVAVALLRMADLVDDSMLSTSAFIGELSLSGEVRPVQGVLPMTIMAQKMGLSEIYVPADKGEIPLFTHYIKFFSYILTRCQIKQLSIITIIYRIVYYKVF